MRKHLKRRAVLAGLAAGFTLSRIPMVRAKTYQELIWDDLIPEGVPYSELLFMDEMDTGGDAWMLPIFDENARKFVTGLDGENVKLPGFIIPLEYSGDGVTGFMLAPFVGACIHVPPPPPNQLVYVTVEEPFPNDQLFEAIWVYGTLSINKVMTDIAEAGYAIQADRVELYEWE